MIIKTSHTLVHKWDVMLGFNIICFTTDVARICDGILQFKQTILH